MSGNNRGLFIKLKRRDPREMIQPDPIHLRVFCRLRRVFVESASRLAYLRATNLLKRCWEIGASPDSSVGIVMS